MDVSGVNNYMAVNPAASSKTTVKKDSSNINIDDFFTLMVAQLQNQTMYDTVDNSQFISQMAQFSMLSNIKESANNTKAAYAISLIGKNVELKHVAFDGSTNIVTGKVDKVSFDKSSACVVVDGVNYDTANIVKVKNG